MGLSHDANTQQFVQRVHTGRLSLVGFVRCEEHEGKVGKQRQQCQPMIFVERDDEIYFVTRGWC